MAPATWKRGRTCHGSLWDELRSPGPPTRSFVGHSLRTLASEELPLKRPICLTFSFRKSVLNQSCSVLTNPRLFGHLEPRPIWPPGRPGTSAGTGLILTAPEPAGTLEGMPSQPSHHLPAELPSLRVSMLPCLGSTCSPPALI